MTNEPWRFTMFHRAAATTAAILAPFGAALAVPAVHSTLGAQDPFAGAHNAPAGSVGPRARDHIGAAAHPGRETLPGGGDQQTRAPGPGSPQRPPEPQDTLE